MEIWVVVGHWRGCECCGTQDSAQVDSVHASAEDAAAREKDANGEYDWAETTGPYHVPREAARRALAKQ